MKRPETFVVLSVCFAIFVLSLPAQEETVPAQEAVSAENANDAPADLAAVSAEEGVGLAARIPEAIRDGFAYLKSVAEEDDEKWVFPPERRAVVVGHKEEQVTRTYRRETVERPVYRYETYQVYQNVKEGDSLDAVTVRKQVTRRRPVRQIGTRKEERLVSDPNGDISRTHTIRRPIREAGGPDFWPAGRFGHNALSLYVRMRGGADDDETVLEAADNLYAIFEAFGLPDLTWDLTWLTAAFSLLDHPKYRAMAEQAAGKLADGQIRSGPAAGLWGPISVNRQTLAELFARHAQLSAAFLEAKQRVEKQPRPREEAAFDAAQTDLLTFRRQMRQTTMLAGDVANVMGTLRLDDDIHPSIVVVTCPEYVYNQVSADMENTALALFGLRIAHRNGVLPKETPSPTGARDRPLVRPEAIATIVNRAIRAVAVAQQQDGSWHESNSHQPVADFHRHRTIPGLPARANTFVRLDSPVHLAGIARGYGALTQAGALLGFAALRPYGRHVLAGDARVRQALREAAEQGFDESVGGQVPPYDTLAYLAEMAPIHHAEPPPDIQKPALSFVLDNQAENGSWLSSGNNRVLLSSSFAQRMKTLPELPNKRIIDRNHPSDLAQAHVLVNEESRNWRRRMRSHYGFDQQNLSTCMALLFLVEQQKPTETETKE